MGREAILKSVKKNKPALIPLPEINLDLFREEIDLLETFKSKVALVGGNIKELPAKETIEEFIKQLYPNSTEIIDCSEETSSLATVLITEKTNPRDLKNVDLAIIKGEIGIAENGAIWISEKNFPIRALPFITNDLVIILEKEQLCENMHDAYSLISERERTFGVFIAGPSKTADIEQCLVIGAQGAITLTVILK